MTKKIKNAPGWLDLTEDRTAFVYLPDRAEVVRQIFGLSIGGLGGYTIAKILNSKNVPAFGTSKRWDQSTIHNMLSSRATIGEYQRKQTINGKEYPIGDPIPGYYPAVIDEDTFETAQQARRKNLLAGRGRKGRLITNLFAGLPTCHYCGTPVKFRSRGSAKSLICDAVLEGGSCFRFAWSYEDFENSFFEFLDKNKASSKFSEELANLRSSIRKQEHDEIYAARAAVAQTLKAIVSKLIIASAGTDPPSGKPDDPIRRNHPERFFVTIFSDGSLRTGYPAAAIPVQPIRKFNSTALSNSLGVSPRQGALTALLAEGVSLTLVAEQLGITLATARWHLREIFKRTNSHSQRELVSIAERTCPPKCGDDGNDVGNTFDSVQSSG